MKQIKDKYIFLNYLTLEKVGVTIQRICIAKGSM